jgi:hypothetical protein
MLHPGWWLELAGQDADTLHDLRKQLRSLRYRLENIEAFLAPAGRQWIANLKQGQSLLGELNDLEVLHKAIQEQNRDGLEATLPQLAWLRRSRRWKRCLPTTPGARPGWLVSQWGGRSPSSMAASLSCAPRPCATAPCPRVWPSSPAECSTRS